MNSILFIISVLNVQKIDLRQDIKHTIYKLPKNSNNVRY
jgi:hypothetical protein